MKRSTKLVLAGAMSLGLLLWVLTHDVQDLSGTWVLDSSRTPSGGIAVPEEARVDIPLEGSTWRGTAACNEYAAEVSVDEYHVTIQDITRTDISCDASRTAAEDAFVTALSGVTSVFRHDDMLVLWGPDVGLWFVPERLAQEAT